MKVGSLVLYAQQMWKPRIVQAKLYIQSTILQNEVYRIALLTPSSAD